MGGRFLILVVFILQTSFQVLYAQNYNFRHYNVDKGLDQSYLYTLLQDQKYYIWLGTGEGLVRFDGHQFYTFTQKDSLSSNFITASLMDYNGGLWFGDNQGKLNHYNKKGFQQISDSLLQRRINTLYEDLNGNIWLGTQGDGMIRLNTGDSIYMQAYPDEMLSPIVNCIVEDENGLLWTGTTDGLIMYEYDPESKTLLLNNMIDALSYNVQDIVKDPKRKGYWIATQEKGVFFYQKKENGTDSLWNFNKQNGLPDNNVNKLYKSSKDELWISVFGKGIVILDLKDQSEPAASMVTFGESSGIPNLFIKDIKEDTEGNVWLATYGGGLIQMYNTMFTNYDVEDGLINNAIKSIEEDENKFLWVGTEKGLSKVKFNSRGEIDTTFNFTVEDGLIDNEISALFADVDNNLWIGTRNGLQRMEIEKSAFKTIQLDGDPGLVNSINSIHGDTVGNIWIATKGGLFQYEMQSGEISSFTTMNGLLHNNIKYVFLDSKGFIWITSPGFGIMRFDGENFEAIQPEEIGGVTVVSCLSEDAKGNLWFGTEGEGVYRFDGEAFYHLNITTGLKSNFCYAVQSDQNNNIWIAYRDGLSKFEMQENKFIHFTKNEGFISDKNNQNASARDSKGNIYFGAMNGLIKYSPAFDNPNTIPPYTYITSVKAFDDEINSGKQGIELPYQEYSITFEFVAISLTDPEKVEYQYYLEGYDRDWQITKDKNSVNYPKLPDGEYTFFVKARNNEGVWNEEPAKFQFSIALPVWKRWWYWAIWTVVLVSGVLAIVKFREIQLMRERTKLKRKIDEATAEITEKRDQIEEQASLLQEKNESITDSITYAKRIQDAILPLTHKMEERYDCAILYRPRDIVSGDFYWYSEKNGEDIFVVADCTGHGVPGAFMSMIGNSLLKEVVNDKEETDPGKVLTELRAGIISMLKQGESEESAKDGMDMAFLKINKKTKKAQYAGAYNPLYKVTKNEEGMNDIVEIEPDRMPIGIYFRDEPDPFKTNEIEFQEGDEFFIFSDGYADQFGGPRNKKFNYKRFRKLLLAIYPMPVGEQVKVLEREFDDYRGEQYQIDDVTIIGIKV